MESNVNKTVNWKTVSLVGGLTVAALAILFMRLETLRDAPTPECSASTALPVLCHSSESSLLRH